MRRSIESPSCNTLPNICVLLATYNGEKWIDEQLSGIFNQNNVTVQVVASDDSSADKTRQILERWGENNDLLLLPSSGNRMGSACRNFLRLIKDAPIGDADYIALSDQDDIWLPNKLIRAIGCMQDKEVDAYSSDVEAFWPGGRKVRIVKSQKQKQFDYLFSSPGPGCTYVFTRRFYESLQEWVVINFGYLQDLLVHDWLIYAFARKRGWQWHIDDQINMLYRQHGGNELGANVGLSIMNRRFSALNSGSFRKDVLAIARAIDDDSWIVHQLQRFEFRDRIALIFYVHQFRRRFRDQLALAISFLLAKN